MKTLKKTVLWVVVILLLAFVVLVSSLNLDSVNLNAFLFKITASLGFVVLCSLLVGVLVGILLSSLLWVWPARRDKRYWQRQYNQLKQNPEFSQNPKKALTDLQKPL